MSRPFVSGGGNCEARTFRVHSANHHRGIIIIGPTYTDEYADREMAVITRAGDRILTSKELRERFLASPGY